MATIRDGPRDYLLEEIAGEQVQADGKGGMHTAKQQLETTKRKLATIGLSINHARYRRAYERMKSLSF